MMKGKLGGNFMTEFVAQRAKIYAYKKIDKKFECKLCKGTKMVFDECKTYLLDCKQFSEGKCCLRIKKHEVYTVNKHRRALNRDDEKKRMQAGGITTFAKGYLARQNHDRKCEVCSQRYVRIFF